MTTLSSMTVVHFPTRRSTVTGRVGQNSTLLTADDSGGGSSAIWFNA
jgi:hypothetical protein